MSNKSYLTREKIDTLLKQGIKKRDFEDQIGFFCTDQGYVYKSDKSFDELENDEICYIPEYYDETDENGLLEDVAAYTKLDFMELCNNIKWRAVFVYEGVDWQCPETYYDETDWEELEEFEIQNKSK